MVIIGGYAMEFLKRNEAPLTESQWEDIDKVVVETAKKTLIGRRFIEITTSTTPAIQFVPYDTIDSGDEGACGLFGEEDCEVVKVKDRKYLPMPLLYKDFKFHWRDIEASKNVGIRIDLSLPAAAASAVASSEDRLIFNGDAAIGFPGLVNVAGRNTVQIGDWNIPGQAFRNCVEAVEKLAENGFYSDIALVLNPKEYAILHRVYENTGVLEINQIKELFSAGVFVSSAVPVKSAIAVATGIENMDLFIAQDLITAYTEYTNMDHYFRVFESVALRIKRPQAICTIE
jgi:uncharacterized linocin/CFP29 family protein